MLLWEMAYSSIGLLSWKAHNYFLMLCSIFRKFIVTNLINPMDFGFSLNDELKTIYKLNLRSDPKYSSNFSIF